jgi:hypothetical protein
MSEATAENKRLSEPSLASQKYATSGILMFAVNEAIAWSNNYHTPVGTGAGTAITTVISGNACVTGYSAGTTSSNDVITLAYEDHGNGRFLMPAIHLAGELWPKPLPP